MKKYVYPLFSKPIYCAKLEGVNKNLLKKISFIHMNNKSGYISKNTNILNEPIFLDIKNKIETEINYYVYNILKVSKKVKTKIISSWIIMHTSSNHKALPHTHGNSVLSGCYYLKAPKNCGNLYFLDQQSINLSRALPFTIDVGFDEENIYNERKWEVCVEDDLFVLFPSDLAHMTGPNESGEKRFCLAFDILFEGELNLSPSEQTGRSFKVTIEAKDIDLKKATDSETECEIDII